MKVVTFMNSRGQYELADGVYYAVDTGLTDAYQVNIDKIYSLYAGLMLNIKVATANTGAATLQINSLDVKDIKKQTSAGLVDLETGDMLDGRIIQVLYDGTYFVASGLNSTELESHAADYTLQVPYGGATTGVANIYVLAAPTIVALTAGMAVSIKINIDSTGASTLNWDGKGAKGIKKANGTDVTNLKNGGIYTLRYDGINFILQGEGGSGNATASDLLSGKTASTDAGDIVGTLTRVSAGEYTFGQPTTNKSAVVAGGWVKAKSVQVFATGILRVKFELRSPQNYTVYGRIYKNAVAYGTQRSTTSSTFVAYTQDLSFSSEDTVELWINGGGYQVQVQNFKICADIGSLLISDSF